MIVFVRRGHHSNNTTTFEQYEYRNPACFNWHIFKLARCEDGATMDESAVFGHVVDELETRDYQPLVHVPGSHQATYADVLDRCETHQITIGGRYPDVLGFTNADRVFAVEVKGSSGLLRGIGQALTYQQGAHVSYLAAAADTVGQHTDLLRSKGIGVIGATNDGVTRLASPPTSESHEQVVDIEG